MTNNLLGQTGRRLIIDTEGDGLLKAIPSRGIRKATKFYCLGGADIDTGELLYYGPAVPKDAVHPLTGESLWTPELGTPAGTLEEGYKALADASMLLAHNGIGFDYPCIEMLVPGWKRPEKSWCTMVIAKVIWPYDCLWGPDMAKAAKLNLSPKDKMQFIKRHSLKAWGIRTGTHKQDYTGGFDAWSPWMANYMMDDILSTLALWRLCEKRLGWVNPEAADVVWPELVIEVENEVARIIEEQEQDGILFDRAGAIKLAAELQNKKAELDVRLVETFGEWWAAGDTQTPAVDRNVKLTQFPDVTVPRVSEKTGKPLAPYVGPPLCRFTTDAPFTPIERTRFSPSSRDHLGQRLQAVYGWKPKKFGKPGRNGQPGKPTVDETTLEEIPEAVMPVEIRQLILDFFVVNKTLGMLVSGSKAWLNLVDDGDRIHGRMDTSGAITGRGTHMDPNLSQVPAIRKEKVTQPDGSTREEVLYGLPGRYGYECRALFIADHGWEQTGVDASALELIDLGHYLVPYDGGKFRDRVCDPARDPHTEHAALTGQTRGDTKTTTYLYIYGGSAFKLSLAIKVEPHEVPALLGYRGLSMMLRNLVTRFDQQFVDNLDDTQKARIAKARKIIVSFEDGIEGIKDLKKSVSEAAARGWLKGMDGRKLHVRSPHSALNTLLQSAGAQSCKPWMMLTHRKLEARGLRKGIDWKQTLWVHDELQFTHKPGLGPVIKECAEEAMREAGVILGLRGAYRTDGKTGRNWAECH